MITELSKTEGIGPELKERFEQFVDHRNLLIHRWFREYGVPTTEEEWRPLTELAVIVELEARLLMQTLGIYVL